MIDFIPINGFVQIVLSSIATIAIQIKREQKLVNGFQGKAHLLCTK